MIREIRKRDGRIVEYSAEKIAAAINKAFRAVGIDDAMLAEKLSDEAAETLSKRFTDKIPGVEDVQDIVENVLIKAGENDAAKAYILYRQERARIREAKAALGVEDDLKLTVNAARVLERRYLRKDENRRVIETPGQMFRRVADTIAAADSIYGKKPAEVTALAEEFYSLMTGFLFLPNSPTLMNAGTPMGQLSACFVVPVEDSMESIFDAVKAMALIHQSGGGTGFSFTKLRPEGDSVKSTGGVASGPISFMRVFDTATDVIKQGGKRRGANMGILRVDHPDILSFIRCKEKDGVFSNYNISVAITDAFMQAVTEDRTYPLINPRTGKTVSAQSARMVFDFIADMAWKSGEPGIIYIDEINRHNPTISLGDIESTNPCITGDTLISTANGLERAEALFESGRVVDVVPDGRLSGERTLVASQVLPTGVKPVFRLKTQEGYELRLTEDHRVLAERGFVPSCELRKGDRIFIQDCKGCFGKGGSLEEGRVLGWLVGDGFISEDKGAVLSFFGDERQLAPDFSDYVSSMIGDYVGTVQIKDRAETRVSSKRLERMLASYGLSRNQKVCVPDCLFCASEEMQRGFLQGIYSSDGHVSGTSIKGYSVRLTSISECFLRDVQRMLINFGIASKMYCNRHERRFAMLPDGRGGMAAYNCQPDHDLVVSKDNLMRFMQEVGFLSQAKQSRLAYACASFCRGPYKERYTARFSELVSDGEEQVYDLMEPATHAFIANGLVVHNCGEQPLLPYESCNLGSMNLSRMVKDGAVDWDLLKDTVRKAVHFLDNVIDANKYPLEEIRKRTLLNRKIGLGVMGFAEMLIQMEIPYDSEEALAIAEKVMGCIDTEAKKKSEELGLSRGSFPNYEKSVWKGKYRAMRNATVTTIAPTGSISIIADCSSGIEPLFAVSYMRNVLGGLSLLETNKFFEGSAKNGGFYSEELMLKVAEKGSVKEIAEVPEKIRRLYAIAQEISPGWHVRMQAAFQKHTDNAVSKTINLPATASPKDIEQAYMLAYRLKCKGITVYRYASRGEQVLYLGTSPAPEKKYATAESEYSGGCAGGTCPL
ncbi:MAG: ribonucleotide reductase N-terminal alpha domain-containing protein [Candidatus Altiarchaeia archaeon]